MEQTPLNETQRKVLNLVAGEPGLKKFYLTGGTALAGYYLFHRISDDLDFFTFAEPDTMFLHAFAKRLKTALKAKEMRFERLYDRNQFFFDLGGQELKIEFTKFPFKQMEKPRKADKVRIDGLRDIAANKLMAMLERFEPKDFVDLFFILQKLDLKKVRRDAETKFGAKIDHIFLGGELVKVRRIKALPKMLKPLTIEELKNFFAERARELSPKIF